VAGVLASLAGLSVGELREVVEAAGKLIEKGVSK
jgi:hypothetical protein